MVVGADLGCSPHGRNTWLPALRVDPCARISASRITSAGLGTRMLRCCQNRSTKVGETSEQPSAHTRGKALDGVAPASATRLRCYRANGGVIQAVPLAALSAVESERSRTTCAGMRSRSARGRTSSAMVQEKERLPGALLQRAWRCTAHTGQGCEARKYARNGHDMSLAPRQRRRLGGRPCVWRLCGEQARRAAIAEMEAPPRLYEEGQRTPTAPVGTLRTHTQTEISPGRALTSAASRGSSRKPTTGKIAVPRQGARWLCSRETQAATAMLSSGQVPHPGPDGISHRRRSA